jgi:STE24 endopeptidase
MNLLCNDLRTMDAYGLIAGCCLAALAALVLWRGSRWQASQIARQGGEDQVHDLRVVLRRMSRIAVVCGVVAACVCTGTARWAGISPAAAAVTVVIAAACLVLPIAAARRPVVSAYASVRGIPVRALRSYRRRAVAVILIVAAFWPLAVVLPVRPSLPGDVVILLAACLAVSPVVTGLLAPGLARLLGPAPLPAPVQARLSALSAELGVSVRGRLTQARTQKVANAGQVGWLPGLRYVLVTDYLLDELTPAEVDAVLAHELGHARHRDLLFRQLLAGLLLIPLFLLLTELAQGGSPGTLLVLSAIVIAGVLGLGRLRAARAIRQELAADDLAVTAVGPAALASALARLTELNAIKRETSLSWDRKVGHPGMAKRIARLQAAGAAGAAGATGAAGQAPAEALAGPEK